MAKIEFDNKKMWESVLSYTHCHKEIMKDHLLYALNDQGLEYKNGEIVSIEPKEGEITMDNKDFNTISEDTAQGLLDAFKGMDDALKGFEDTWQRNYGVLVDEIKVKCAEKLLFYTDKYAQATFLTRWYWKRKMEKFIKGIDVLKEL